MTAVVAAGLAACGSAARPMTRPRPARAARTARVARVARAAPPFLAGRVCRTAARAAARDLHRAVATQVTGADPADITCALTMAQGRLELVDEPSSQAWMEFDTTEVHQVQAYGSGPVQDPREIPRTILDRASALAGWIPEQRELFATDASQSRSGSYVTVIAEGRPAGRPGSRREISLARAVVLAALAAGPAHRAIVPPS